MSFPFSKRATVSKSQQILTWGGIAELKEILGHYEAILKSLLLPKPPSTGVSFLITHHQKAELRERGFTDDQIHTMTPEEAHRLLGLGD